MNKMIIGALVVLAGVSTQTKCVNDVIYQHYYQDAEVAKAFLNNDEAAPIFLKDFEQKSTINGNLSEIQQNGLKGFFVLAGITWTGILITWYIDWALSKQTEIADLKKFIKVQNIRINDFERMLPRQNN